jgi:predicted RND superfamily exporter protein
VLPAPSESSNGTTQLIQTAPNVLSKEQLLCMLEAQERLAERPSLEVVETSSAAQVVAEQIDPNARTIDAQIRAVEQATPTEIEAAVRAAAEQPGFRSLLTKDFNPQSASASGTLATVSHDVAVEGGAGQGGDSPLTPIRLRSQEIVSSVGGDIRVFGSGITSAEFGNIIGDSLLIVTPAAVVLILVFLVFSYRDLIDLLLGILALVMALIWTFGFMGIAGIPFSQLLIAIPPLLLAVGIDFGIHAIDRYREERAQGRGIDESMRITTDQSLVAFFIVTGTTVFGFGSNIISDLPPARQFGIVAAVGITFTFLIFGVFLPAAKVSADRLRELRSPRVRRESARRGGIGCRPNPFGRRHYLTESALCLARRRTARDGRRRGLGDGHPILVFERGLPAAGGQPRLHRSAPRTLRTQRVLGDRDDELPGGQLRLRRGRHRDGLRRGPLAPGQRSRTTPTSES